MKKIKTVHDLLPCKPKRVLEWEEDSETHHIVVLRPKFTNELAQRLFSPFMKSTFFRVKLDALGTLVWQNCDGETSVEEIGKILGKKFGAEIEPIYDRLARFINQMHKGQFIELLCPQDEEDTELL